MPIYYRSPDLVITDRVFEVRRPEPMRLMVDELRNAHIVRGDLHWATVLATCTAVVAVALVAVGWPFLDTVGDYVAALLVLAATSIAAGACVCAVPRVYELRATYRTHEVRLFYSADRRTFGQVQRGLIRALEATRHRHEQSGTIGHPDDR